MQQTYSITFINLILKKIIIFIYFLSTLCLSLENHTGHLKPFGQSGPFIPIITYSKDINPLIFFKNHVSANVPLLLEGGAKISPAFLKWTDSYLASIEGAENIPVAVENGKLENRSAGLREISFKKFLSIYNRSDIYLVNPLPMPLEKDIILPLSLQCKDIYENTLVENVMWMSSGNTSSVVHTDTVDNIICLFRGYKTITLIDKHQTNQVFFEHDKEGYSEINVHSVDYLKYPGLINASYYIANLKPGDCLFIPYKWIHQVNSKESNIAVNIWWVHYKSLYYFNQINEGFIPNTCNNVLDTFLTFNKLQFHGFGSENDFLLDFKDRFLQYISQNLNINEFIDIFLQEDDNLDIIKASTLQHLKDAFTILDSDKDEILTLDEVRNLSNDGWEDFKLLVEIFDSKIERTNSIIGKKYNHKHSVDEL